MRRKRQKGTGVNRDREHHQQYLRRTVKSSCCGLTITLLNLEDLRQDCSLNYWTVQVKRRAYFLAFILEFHFSFELVEFKHFDFRLDLLRIFAQGLFCLLN